MKVSENNKHLGQSQCPQCVTEGHDNKGDNLGIYSNGVYCFRCGYERYADQMDEGEMDNYLIEQNRSVSTASPVIKQGLRAAILKSRNIPEFITKRYGVQSFNGQLIFPFFKDGELVAQKCKTKGKQIQIRGDISSADMFGSQLWGKAHKKLVITEGEEDALAVASVVHESIHVTTLTNGAASVKTFIEKHYKRLAEYEVIILCFDNDEAGQKATQKFKKLFTSGQVAITKLSEKDACDMLIEGKAEELKWAIMNAYVPKPSGITRVGDLTPEDFTVSLVKGYDLMFPKLTNALGGLRKGELTMLTAGTGIGKSTVVNNLVFDFIMNKGLKIADIKLEENQLKTRYQYLAMHQGLPPRETGEAINEISDEAKQSFIKDFSDLYLFNQFGSVDSGDLLVLLDYCATVLEVDFIFLDHITIAVEGLDLKKSLRESVQTLTVKLREMIDRTGVGVVCVCHLSRPPKQGLQYDEGRRVNRSDLKEASSLEQVSDTIIAIEGNLTNEDVNHERVIHLLKARYGNKQEVYCDKYTWSPFTGKITLIEESDDGTPF